MDIWGAITVLARRFYLTVPLTAIAVVLAWLYAGSVAPEYHASASMVMIGPTAVVTKDVPQPINPYATLGISTIAAALQIDASGPRSVQQILQAGNTTNFSVSGRTRSSIIDITATSKSPRQAVSTAAQLMSIMQTNLAARQQPYAPNKANQVTVQALSAPGLAAKDTSAKKKAEAVAIGAAIAISILLTLFIDSILRTRSRRRGRRSWVAPTIDESAVQRTPVVRP